MSEEHVHGEETIEVDGAIFCACGYQRITSDDGLVFWGVSRRGFLWDALRAPVDDETHEPD